MKSAHQQWAEERLGKKRRREREGSIEGEIA
jgi:hypothetical protein